MKPAVSFRALRLRSGQAPQDLRHLILSAVRDLPRPRSHLPAPFRAKRRPGRSAWPRIIAFVALLLGLSSVTSTLPGQSAQPWAGTGIAAPYVGTATAGVRAVRMVGFTVSNMERSVDFYTRVLDFTVMSDAEVAGPEYDTLEGVSGGRLRVVRLGLGSELLQLTQFLVPEGRPFPPDSRSNDHWFQHVAIIVSDMDRAYARLRQFRVRHASTAPQLLPRTIPNAAGIRAFYFRDPDGHYLEILQFPPDKGDPKWRQAGGRLFLGIDHTAIVVGRTEASLAFYRDILGFRVAGESLNFGTEQEHLNNVPGARLHITGLRSSGGPGIEFLEYLSPGDGRTYPTDSRANDLVHWETTVVVPDIDSAAALLQRGGFRTMSTLPVELPDSALGFRRAILVRDPDGHVIQLVES
jgi:catechol 2,3-dioxygenase-like lactoylglutathione lyase family enzyme